jgi:hypothetical protein
MKNKIFKTVILMCCLFLAATARAQTSAFTYQGKLTDTSAAANGQYDFTFRLFDSESNGTQIGANAACNGVQSGNADAVCDNVQVTNGIFTVNLDFGSGSFADGAARFLEILVRTGTSTGAYTTLAPRQQITSSPFSVKSLSSATADNSLNLGGVAANQYVLTTDSRLSDERNPLPNSPNYIQANPAMQQTGTSFNIAGNGILGGNLSASQVTTNSILSPTNSTQGINLFPGGGGVTINGPFYANGLDSSANPGGILLGTLRATTVRIGGIGTGGNSANNAIDITGNTFVSRDLAVLGRLLPSSIEARLSGGTLLIGASALQTAAVSISRPTTVGDLTVSSIFRLSPQSNPGSCSNLADTGKIYYREAQDTSDTGALVLCRQGFGAFFGWVRLQEGMQPIAEREKEILREFKEQQEQIERQKQLIERQQQQIDALKKTVCLLKPDAEICKE